MRSRNSLFLSNTRKEKSQSTIRSSDPALITLDILLHRRIEQGRSSYSMSASTCLTTYDYSDLTLIELNEGKHKPAKSNQHTYRMTHTNETRTSDYVRCKFLVLLVLSLLGDHPIATIAYTSSFKQLMSLFRSLLSKNEFSLRSLKLTEDILAVNAANYTVW